ncbi:helix-turn-helix domain-containing protein [Streptomyces sp. NBC_00704]|uniref:helix-turn-helix domain-containing protein n=1 Tax=Streptomyces sp. NBC_00704 TaxID=2975809 RepID=UPI002E34A63E|nr:helix-turn-helix transcriptional regulator [Streptomyces sp. NBC_00704]
MGAWQPLPDGLPSEVRHFVEQMRQLKDGTGLSLAALGARTAYSKSSWQRYLNGVQPPPRQAVVALCRVAGLAGAEAERHVVRWELAVEAWPRPAPANPAAEYEEDPTLPWWDRLEEAPAPPPAPRPAGRLLLYAVLLLLALLTTAVGGAVAFG